MEKKLIRKAIYSCSCSKEYITDDIPKTCPICMRPNFYLTRVVRFFREVPTVIRVDNDGNEKKVPKRNRGGRKKKRVFMEM
jgi:hypothetical protein